ncbi:MAG: hypothetical protein WC205_16795 [Opitutaceae bacterium]|jgi:hypothetical protein
MSSTDSELKVSRATKALLIAEGFALTQPKQVADLQQKAVAQLMAVTELENKAALGAVISGLTLKRVKASLKHGEWISWQSEIRQVEPAGDDLRSKTHRGAFLPSIRQCAYYMRLAEVFVDKTKVQLPELLALPGDQLSLDMADSAQARAFAEKLKTFVGDQSLNDLLDRHRIKERKDIVGETAKGGNLGRGAEPPSMSPVEQLAAEKAEAIRWYQAQCFTWKNEFYVARSFTHLPDEATQDGELTLPQFRQMLADTLAAVDAEATARAKPRSNRKQLLATSHV